MQKWSENMHYNDRETVVAIDSYNDWLLSCEGPLILLITIPYFNENIFVTLYCPNDTLILVLLGVR